MSTVVASSGVEAPCTDAAAESVAAEENSSSSPPEGPTTTTVIVAAAAAASAETKAAPIPAAEARKRRKAIITSQRQGVAAIGEDNGVTADAAADLLLVEQGAAIGFERGDYNIGEDAAPLADEAAVAAAAAVASNNAADEEAATKESVVTAKAAPPRGRKRKSSVDEEEDRSDDDDASQSDGSKAKNGCRSKKTQIRYDPSVPMDKEQLAAWRREARRVRNRESAAASRQRIRGRISELEVEVNDWKTKYETAVGRLQQMEDAKQKHESANL